jgi:DNA polymerase
MRKPTHEQLDLDVPPRIKTLGALREAEAGCTRCPLYKDATQVVPGEGPAHARFMLVGEQPGDKEDLAGKPFVGPAGRLLDEALEDAGIPRNETFVTNAVKHFKFEMRGKRRLHKKPNTYEIDRCKWWQDLERLIVKPEVVVALGATAARSLVGKTVTIGKVRGTPIDLHDGSRLLVTIHPSALLRMDDAADKATAFRAFVSDLKAAARLVFKKAA